MKRILVLLALAAALSAKNGSAQAPAAQLAPSGPVAATATNTARPDCTLGDHATDCETHSVVFSQPSVQNGHESRVLINNDFKTYGPSINFGLNGGWTVSKVINAPHVIFGTSGIDQYNSAVIYKNGTGDLAGIYYYVYGGGRAASTDEGVEPLVVEGGEIHGYFHGAISGPASRGATSLVLTDQQPSGPLHWKYTCDGCMLLDISKGNILGSLNGASQPFSTTYLYQLPTARVTVAGSPGQLPLTHAWCTTLSEIPPTATAAVGTSRTVNCTLGSIGGSTPAFTAGGVVTIAGQWYPEQAALTAVGRPSGGVQSLTLLARNPNPTGSLIFQGGIAGQSLSFDDNLALTGFRSSYYVFGSVDGVNLIYGSQVAGSLLTNQLPRSGSEAETTTSGFHLYPSAEIVANSADPSSPSLEPNNVDWQTGDTVEDPRFQTFGGTGLRDNCSSYTPSEKSGAYNCMLVEVSGPNVGGFYKPFRIINYNPLSMYRQGGGVLDPVPAMKVEGTYGDILQVRLGPSSQPGGAPSSLINVIATADNNKGVLPFNLFNLPSLRSGAARVIYDPSTKLIAFPQGITTGTLGTSSNCFTASASPNCGSAASGSIAIASGASSVTVVTSAVTADSQILVTPDASLSAKLNVSCNRNPAQAFAPFGIVARVPGHSFTLAIAASAQGSPNCYNYTIVN
jgi:hypothetical protein